MSPVAPMRILLLLLAFTLPGMASASNPIEPTRFTREHVDLPVVWNPGLAGSTNALSMQVHAEELGLSLAPTNATLVGVEASRLELPAGFEAFGPAGSPFWVLPQSQDPALLYPGFSAEDLPRGLFAGRVEIRLLSLEGPGDFFVWQADQFGGIDMAMNSRDGITPEDHVSPLVGGHDHYNLGFSTNGLYRVVLQPVARPIGSTTNLYGQPAAFRFAIEPIPTNTVPASLWERWQAEQFPGVADALIRGPEADPDHDGASNLLEFASGTVASDPRSVLQPTISRSGTDSIQLALPVIAERMPELLLVVVSARDLAGPWTEEPENEFSGVPLRTWTELLPPDASRRFHRIRCSLR